MLGSGLNIGKLFFYLMLLLANAGLIYVKINIRKINFRINMKKLTPESLISLDKGCKQYFYAGYDLHFIHGWFAAYLTAPSDSEEDMVIPTYLVLNEKAITNEKEFSKFIDNLMRVYSDIANNIFDLNKQLKPLVDYAKPNNFSHDDLNDTAKKNLLIWLYGYLCGTLSIDADITEYCNDEKLLEEKFYPALYTICCGFLLLNKSFNIADLLAPNVVADFKELTEDIVEMWEADDGKTIIDEINNLELSQALSSLVAALNNIFYVTRIADERKFANKQNSLLNKLNTKL